MALRNDRAILVVALLGVSVGTAGATERLVPSQYATIQAAIDACVNGDVVIVADGIYTGTGNRDIDFLGKAITVRSEHGAAGCIIDAQGSVSSPHRGFRVHSGETAAATLAGFTIQTGRAPYEDPCQYSGGGILCRDGASPTIRDCIIRSNSTQSY